MPLSFMYCFIRDLSLNLHICSSILWCLLFPRTDATVPLKCFVTGRTLKPLLYSSFFWLSTKWRLSNIFDCFVSHESISWQIIVYARQPIDSHYEIYIEKSHNFFFCSLQISTILVCILVSLSSYYFYQFIKSNSCSKYFRWCRLKIQINKDFSFCCKFHLV